jgi:hypothetical protein
MMYVIIHGPPLFLCFSRGPIVELVVTAASTVILLCMKRKGTRISPIDGTSISVRVRDPAVARSFQDGVAQ